MISYNAKEVMDDLKARERRRRLGKWRRMVERYADDGLIPRWHVRCGKCGRTVDLLCVHCLEEY